MPLSEIGIYYVIIGTQCCSSLRVTAKVLLAYYVDLAKNVIRPQVEFFWL